MKKRYLSIMLIILSLVSLLIGAKNITISDLISFNNDSINVMLISRLPRLIAIILAGMGMSICGLIMQQISKNKFVSPTTGATIDSAQLGIVVAMILMPCITNTKSFNIICICIGWNIHIYEIYKDIKI